MANQPYDLKKIVEWLGFVLRCPICNYRYNIKQTKVLETEHDEAMGEARLLIHSDCGKCKSSIMFNVEIRGPEVFSVGMVTDLTQGDSNKFKSRKPIEVNEIIGIHKELKKIDGDFISLFADVSKKTGNVQ